MATTSSRPTPPVCAGQGFVIQVVNSQVQISNHNLNKLTAPIPMEAFFGDFANKLFDPPRSYNHSTGRLVHDRSRVGLRDVLRRLHRREHDLRRAGPWNIYFLDLGTFGGDPDETGLQGCSLGLCLADQPNLGPRVLDLDLDQPIRPPRCGVRYRLLWPAYIMVDKVALALGSPFPNVVAFDISTEPCHSPDFHGR